MLRNRIIPTLLLSNNGLVKTKQFKNPIYIGDPINAVRIFNEKEVDELVILDIKATIEKREINYSRIEEIVSEAFMPVGYGGGVKNIQQIEKLFKLGIEKVILNTAAFSNQSLIQEASRVFGNQSIVVAIDVKKDFFGNYRVYTNAGTQKQNLDFLSYLHKFEELGVGEIIVNSIDKDGIMSGYDYNLIKIASENLSIPMIACGGAGQVEHLANAIRYGASAVAAGSMFVFHGKHRAVLISYPKYEDIDILLNL